MEDKVDDNQQDETLISMRNDLRAASYAARAELELSKAPASLSELKGERLDESIERDEHFVQHKIWQNVISSLEYSIECYIHKKRQGGRTWLEAYSEQMLAHQQKGRTSYEWSQNRQFKTQLQLVNALSALRNIGALSSTQEAVLDTIIHMVKSKKGYSASENIKQAQIASALHMSQSTVRDSIRQIQKKVADIMPLYDALSAFKLHMPVRWHLAAALGCLPPKQRFCLVESLRGRTLSEILDESKRVKRWNIRTEKEVQEEITKGISILRDAFNRAQIEKESVKLYLSGKDR